MRSLTLFLVLINILASNTTVLAQKANWSLDLVTGGTLRTTIFRTSTFKPDYYPNLDWNDFYWERNIQGLAGHLGIELSVPNPKIIVSYAPSIRHSMVYWKTTRFVDDPEEIKILCPSCGPNTQQTGIYLSEDIRIWTVDHHFNILKETRNQKNRFGIGISIVNWNTTYVDKKGRKRDLQWLNYNFLYQRRLWKELRGEFKVIYIPKGQYPTTNEQDFLSYSLGFFYSFQPWRRKKQV